MNSTSPRAKKVESGERYRVIGGQESFTVVDVDDVVAKVQYEGGGAEDYLLNTSGEFIDDYITKLPENGPTVADACAEDSHVFTPSSPDTGIYHTICRRCELSLISLIDHAGQLAHRSIPWQCPRCEEIFLDTDSFGGFDRNGNRVCSDCDRNDSNISRN